MLRYVNLFHSSSILFITNDTHLDTTKELFNFLSCQSLPDEDLKRNSEPWGGSARHVVLKNQENMMGNCGLTWFKQQNAGFIVDLC